MPCGCENGPKCQYHYCGKPAVWSSMMPTWRTTPPLWAPRFFCDPCLKLAKEAWAKPLKGIDRPPHADEDWRPSLSDHLHWARIDMANEERRARERAGIDTGGVVVVHPWEIKARGWTTAQIETVKRLRALTAKHGIPR